MFTKLEGAFVALVLLAGVSVSADVNSSAEGPRSVSGALFLFWYWEGPNRSCKMVKLYAYDDGNLAEVWSERPGDSISSATFSDMNSDGKPEIIVQMQTATTASLAIYENISGNYTEISRNNVQLRHLSKSRSRTIDYYGDGRGFLITTYADEIVAIDYNSSHPFVLRNLSQQSYYGFDVGDVNHDARPDIVHASEEGFVILDNRGDGNFESLGFTREQITAPHPIDEIRIGDVDGDGLNEIVMVGCCQPRVRFCIVKYVDGVYESIFTYHPPTGFGAVESLDLGDVDLDGVLEIVTHAESFNWPHGMGVSIWDYSPDQGTYVRTGECLHGIGGGMLSLRVSAIDSSGVEKILALVATEYLGDGVSPKLQVIYQGSMPWMQVEVIPVPDVASIDGFDVWPVSEALVTPGLLFLVGLGLFLRRSCQPVSR